MSQLLHIAIADDEADIREYLQKVLPRLGHRVVAAARNGRELIEQCRTLHPHLVITDVRMPDIDGVEAARILYQDHQIPTVLMSAHLAADQSRGAETGHILGYLGKPIRQADLRAVIDRIAATGSEASLRPLPAQP